MWYILNFIPANLVQNYLVLGTTYSSEITTTNFLIVFWKLSVEIALKCRVKITIRKTISYYYTRNCAREALDCAKCHFNSFNYVALANYLQAAIMELLHRFIQNVLVMPCEDFIGDVPNCVAINCVFVNVNQMVDIHVRY